MINQAQEIFAAEAPAVTLYYPNGRWGYRPAAYNGWIADPGHGVFTKRSFLPGYANPEPAPEEEPEEVEEPVEEESEPEAEDEAAVEEEAGDDVTEDGGGLGTVGLLAIGAVVVAVGGAMFARQRSGRAADTDIQTVTD